MPGAQELEPENNFQLHSKYSFEYLLIYAWYMQFLTHGCQLYRIGVLAVIGRNIHPFPICFRSIYTLGRLDQIPSCDAGDIKYGVRYLEVH